MKVVKYRPPLASIELVGLKTEVCGYAFHDLSLILGMLWTDVSGLYVFII